ncbi:hypothetical protein [Sediminitomix flava]|uniref:Uncharacterized protein n=1 Tax=Sediminitomix flava TaxID=379075 RepID=A0A315ZEX4_SEDFL|nr:hypothetical protein [Sediminitomix flava]PWJ43723.1 hypothetical protein BC781_10169 [Sediminitomix flava]
MDILKTATDWAKAEVFSTSFFIVFGILFLLGSAGFWHLGKTEMAKAFVTPTIVAGILLLIIGIGLVGNNMYRLNSFPKEYEKDTAAFLESEITRADKTVKEFQNGVLKVIPCIIAVAAMLIFFMEQPMWRAIGITTIAMMSVILLVDINANARINDYHKQLLLIEKSK